MMLFLIASAPDTQEFKTATRMARDSDADICLLQNAVYAARSSNEKSWYVLSDDMNLRGLHEHEISGKPVDYDRLVDLMTASDKVVGLF
jgi:sulfur relay protein TusB/DsrH